MNKKYLEIIQDLFASREAEITDLLEQYCNLLTIWNSKINLVSSSTLNKIWDRHIADSLQLLYYLPKDSVTICDFGSGAGLPGMIIAMCSNHKVNLLESDSRKTAFLYQVSKLCIQKPKIINDRIESICSIPSDFIISRAFAPLNNLLSFAFPFQMQNSTLLLHKGKNVMAEINEAEKFWSFTYKLHNSYITQESYILEIKNCRKL